MGMCRFDISQLPTTHIAATNAMPIIAMIDCGFGNDTCAKRNRFRSLLINQLNIKVQESQQSAAQDPTKGAAAGGGGGGGA